MAQHQKVSSLTSERSSSVGDAKMCLLHQSMQVQEAGKIKCVWVGSGEKGSQPMNLNLHLPGIDV